MKSLCLDGTADYIEDKGHIKFIFQLFLLNTTR